MPNVTAPTFAPAADADDTTITLTFEKASAPIVREWCEALKSGASLELFLSRFVVQQAFEWRRKDQQDQHKRAVSLEMDGDPDGDNADPETWGELKVFDAEHSVFLDAALAEVDGRGL